MSNISYTLKIKRIAILDPQLTKGQMLPVGEVEEYTKNDLEIKVNVRLNDNIPPELEAEIIKNPGCIRISEVHDKPTEVLIIPSRPKLVL